MLVQIHAMHSDNNVDICDHAIARSTFDLVYLKQVMAPGHDRRLVAALKPVVVTEPGNLKTAIRL